MNQDAKTTPSIRSAGWYRRISFGGLSAFMNSIGTGWIFVLLILINIDIIGRTIFNAPLRGVTEIVGMTIVACVFLQLPHTIKVNRLTRSDIILWRLEKRSPKIKLAFEFFYNLVGALLLIFLFISSIPILVEVWHYGDYEGVQGGFTAPIWPIKLIIVIGSLVAAIQCLINSYNCFRRMRTPNSSAGRSVA